MAFPAGFLTLTNFSLAFTRVTRGANQEYKAFYRHLFPSYRAALDESLRDLITDIRRGRYHPQRPTIIYQPKTTGVLRPLGLLSLRDQIVYQSIVNVIADRFSRDQQSHALKRCFGAIYAGAGKPFFYRSWRVCYRAYNTAMEASFRTGKRWVADFDLVSFYELIDHEYLQQRLAKRVRNQELLQLLSDCLGIWSTRDNSAHFKHGIPQGPEASAFLAECILFDFDAIGFKNVTYLRYIDDIRLMAQDEVPARRALLKLDLAAKDVGLVPQAQKINLRRVNRLSELQKAVPSGLLAARGGRRLTTRSKGLLRVFRRSLRKQRGQWKIIDVTKFKFALLRLPPRKDVLRRIAILLLHYPDCSWVFGQYLKRFPRNKAAAEVLLNALQRDPTYDAAAANYIDALNVCEPARNFTSYRRVVETAKRRSEENSMSLSLAVTSFRGRRRSPSAALALIASSDKALARSILIHQLFAANSAPHPLSHADAFLQTGTLSQDEDFARYCGWLMLTTHPWTGSNFWRPRRTAHPAVQLLAFGLGLRARPPKKAGALEHFFAERKVRLVFPWRRALTAKDLRHAEQLCIQVRSHLGGSPDAQALALDSLNDHLLQSFSRHHPNLKSAFARAAGSKPHPDLGNWLRNPALTNALPNSIAWFSEVHDTRLGSQLAHAKRSSGKYKGAPTGRVSFRKINQILGGAAASWRDLLVEWKKVL